jgi:hypothetical protein
MTKRNLEASIDIDDVATPDWAPRRLRPERLPEWSPQCQRMQLLGRLREGVYTLNWNRQGRKFWPSASKLVRVEPNQPVAFRTLTNNSVWSFEITPTGTGSRLTERRVVPPHGGGVDGHCQNLIGGEGSFDDEMLDGIKTTVARSS